MIRPATASDCELFFRIRNAPTVRSVSFDHQAISWDGHERWYAAALQSPQHLMFVIADASGRGIGYVRVTRHDPLGYVSIAIEQDLRHRGFGVDSLHELDKAVRDSGLLWLVALIKPPNPASHGAFVKSGYDLAYHDAGVLTMLVKPIGS